MGHRSAHPEPVEDCFGCKVQGIGFQGLKSRQGADPTRTTPVITEEGPRAGAIGGVKTEHWDGRQDATVHAPALSTTATVKEL